MKRREVLKAAALLPLLAEGDIQEALAAEGEPSRGERRQDLGSDGNAREPAGRFARVRPGDPDWPTEEKWSELAKGMEGTLIKVQSPIEICRERPDSAECKEIFRLLKNPYYIGENPGLTQTSGWVDAWTSAPSVYAVAAKSTADVVAAVNFARNHRLRLVVRGGGHSFQGTSCAPDSLLIWTREMNAITLVEDFVPQGCEATHPPQPAVTVGSGALWLDAYDAVTTRGGRYVQGGGCATVGVAGLIQSGGFGSFSKRYGLAAAGLLEAEIVTADGQVRLANASTNAELFWALRGGGGGSYGVVTRLTLRTHDLPRYFGAVSGKIAATSDTAYKALIDRLMTFYSESLFNPHWGEQISFRPNNIVDIFVVFQGLSKPEAEKVWKPFIDWVGESQSDYRIVDPVRAAAGPARLFWSPAMLKAVAPDAIIMDDRPSATPGKFYWATNRGECGQVLHAYQSHWLPQRLLTEDERPRVVDALFESTRQWGMSLHFNKGLAGAPEEAIAAAKETAVHPAALDAFALAITASSGPPAFPGVQGHEPDVDVARANAKKVTKAMDALRQVSGEPGAYVSESDFFDPQWQASYWGPKYSRLLAVKKQYDPDGLFFVHHGVGSDEWSADGFTRLI